jgi:uncharacterized membrane protein
MINIILAVFFSTCIIITFRLFGKYKVDNLQAITFNYFVASILSFISFNEWITPMEIIRKSWFIWAAFNGVLFILVFYIFAKSAQKTGVAITSVASKMSVLIPVLIGILIYNDPVNWLKVTGIIIAFPAFYLILSRKKEEKVPLKYFILPLLLFAGTGSNDSIMKYARTFYVFDDYLLFLGTIFTLALIVGVFFWITGITEKKQPVNLKNIFAGMILGILNYLSTMFFLRSVAIYDSSEFFPIFNVSIVSMGALVGYFLFKENLLIKNWIGIFLAIITIILIAIA